MITSNVARSGPSRVIVRKHSPGGHAMGLLHDSVVVADNLATVLERQIDKGSSSALRRRSRGAASGW